MEEEQQQDNPQTIVTSCRDCIFAVYDDSESPPMQVGCEFDRIEKFEENGAEIVGQNDGEKQYLLIYGRKCKTQRGPKWGATHSKGKWKEIVKEQIQLKVDIVIKVNINNDIDDIVRSIEGVNSQELKPNSLYISVSPNSQLHPVDIVNKVKETCRVSWKVERNDINKVPKYLKGTHYAIFNAGYEIPVDFTYKLNKVINEDLEMFVALRPDNYGNGQTLQICRDIDKSVLTLKELEEMGERTSTEFMIKKFEDFWPLSVSE